MKIDFELVDSILRGIDKCEVDDPGGWWETSTGAEFGKGKLQELKNYLMEVEKHSRKDFFSELGSIKTEKKALASRENGKKGGRPRNARL